ncbi:cysteinyl-tRNA synthetase [Enteropsectra breve]|nr:cysteinyl-tRNA synthetase [Enteropsectra breve]
METPVVYNTLTKKAEKLVLQDGRKIKMYICGPTVYDSPHIGHARTYLSFDVIRRVLKDYFNYDVELVMNITNIDDKIITRAAERNISCNELSDKYEDEFFTEMDRLNVLRPDYTTRVTEYIAEILAFIEKLESRELTYESNGSIYFNLEKYKAEFSYNLLRPKTVAKEAENSENIKNSSENIKNSNENIKNSNEIKNSNDIKAAEMPKESEEIDNISEILKQMAIEEKISKEDFVLWKASKQGEPTYLSKWGPGRPGWHIECSAMAASIFGSKLDVHAGGIDLAFPHHENEVAQCQGHFGEKWVSYFWHTGHLKIDGLKMSKSLKNFWTIGEILEKVSVEGMRILFLQHQWNRDMNYDKDQLVEAEATRKKIYNFISNVEQNIKRNDKGSLSEMDRTIRAKINATKEGVHSALLNNFNTPKALELMLELISSLNQAMKDVHSDVLSVGYSYIKKMLGVFGLKHETKDAGSQEEKLAELLNSFRAAVRKAARSKADAGLYFKLSDVVRDEAKKINFAIEDTPEKSVIRRIY